jgi:sorbitol-specific phosphotransferase system component IIBC
MPPNVAQNSSAFSSRLARTVSPLASSTVSASTQALKAPWTWCALPWTSLAMHPPTVTNFVPGVIMGNQPRGVKSAMSCARLTPASQVKMPVPSSNAR